MIYLILAGGEGKRMNGHLGDIPKHLIRINGKSLLERSMSNILLDSRAEVIISVGGNRKFIESAMKNYPSVKLIQDTELCGSMSGISESLEHGDECIVLDGDLIYEPRFLKEILNHPKDNTLLVTPLSGNSDSVYVVLDEKNVITYLGKKRPSLESNLFEFVGISKFSPAFLRKMIDFNKVRNKDIILNYEDCAFIVRGSLQLNGLVLPDLKWAEIDTEGDIENAEKVASGIDKNEKIRPV